MPPSARSVGHDEAVTQQLQHLTGAYFHHDYDLESESPGSVIDSFLNGEGEASAAELVSEIDRLLASPLSERQLLDVWIGAWGASYDPRDDEQHIRGWLTEVRNRLSHSAS
jgi:hypothetical protein